MLCDDLAADGASAAEMNVGSVIERIGKAQKFVLGAEFASVADALSEDYTGLVRAFEHCRLPYPRVWIEVAHADRPRFYTASMHAPDFQTRPKRVGYLLEAIRPDLSAWKTHMMWSLPNGKCSASSLAMEFDMTRPLTVETLPTMEAVERQRDRFKRGGILNMNMPSHPGWDHASESVKLAMLRHINPVMTDYPPPSPKGLPAHRWDEFYEAIGHLARADWAGEPGFLLAVIGLLNARNATDVFASDLRRLNKARAKRGAPPLFEYKILHIARRQINRVYGDGDEIRLGRSDRSPMREHFCRGHFKVRKTGVFFWHPHLRGDRARGHIEKEYEL